MSVTYVSLPFVSSYSSYYADMKEGATEKLQEGKERAQGSASWLSEKTRGKITMTCAILLRFQSHFKFI